MEGKVYLYPVWVRLWHITNGILCIILILSGVSLQYSGVDSAFIRFDIAVKTHNISGIILSINYLFFISGNLFTSNGKHYRLKRQNFIKNLILQLRYYTFGIFKKQAAPFPITEDNKFNPLQRFTYVLATYICLTLLVITGWGFLFPEFIPATIFGASGILVNDIIHVSFAFIVSIFLFVHVYFCTIGTKIGSNFKSILTGWHHS